MKTEQQYQQWIGFNWLRFYWKFVSTPNVHTVDLPGVFTNENNTVYDIDIKTPKLS